MLAEGLWPHAVQKDTKHQEEYRLRYVFVNVCDVNSQILGL